MIKNKLKDKRHIIAQEEKKYSPEELQLMKTQDEKYIQMKLAMETKVALVHCVLSIYNMLLL